MQKKGNVIVEGEDLNVLIGSKPLKGEEKEAVKKQLLQLFDEEYGIEEEDCLLYTSGIFSLTSTITHFAFSSIAAEMCIRDRI